MEDPYETIPEYDHLEYAACAHAVCRRAGHREYYAQGRLKYGSDALFTARLQNYNDTLSGSGYEFGYYDADRSFVPLAVTDEQKITVTVDSNAYVSGGVCYETRPTNYSTILGAYHIELLTAFGSYEEALAVAQSYPKGLRRLHRRGVSCARRQPRELR